MKRQMPRILTDYEVFETVSAQTRRLVRQEELILEVTEALAEAMNRQGVTKAELARRLGKSRGFVSQVLAGGRNLTLRTIADVADALGCQIRVQTVRRGQWEVHWPRVSSGSFQRVTIPATLSPLPEFQRVLRAPRTPARSGIVYEQVAA